MEDSMKENKSLKAAALILAGGAGTRMGGDKQYMLLGGRPVLERTADVFLQSGLFSEIIIALTPENEKKHGSYWKMRGVKTAAAGSTRTGSLINASAMIESAPDIVAVHDGARPLVDQETIDECVRTAARKGCCIAAVPVKDTIKTAEEGVVTATPDRKTLFAVHTPQAFVCREIREAIEKGLKDGFRGTDEASFAEKQGKKVFIVDSKYDNIKVTTSDDLIIAEALLKKREEKQE